MEDLSADEKIRKSINAGIPSEMTQDPAALARELRWRCKQALGEGSDDEADKPPMTIAADARRVTRKRKLENGRAGSQVEDKQLVLFGPRAKTRNTANE